jgi:hypothetical protein
MPDQGMRGLGRLPEPYDRDRLYLMRAAQPSDADAPLVGLRTYHRGPIYDQGKTGTCVGHAWRSWLDGEPLRTRRGPIPFDLYDRCTVADSFPENDHDTERVMGTSVRAGAKVLSALGHVKSYLWAFTVDDVRRWVLSGQGGVVFGLDWYSSMNEPNEEGIIRIGGRSEGGHAIYCFGADDRTGHVFLQNSWGTDWGGWPHPLFPAKKAYLGCAKLPYDDLALLLRQHGEACTATEQAVVPAAPTR